MKKILIALDYNPLAQKIAEQGYALAKAMDAKVALVHVMAEPNYYFSTGYDTIMGFDGYAHIDPFYVDNNIELKKSSVQFLEKSRHHLGDETIQTIIESGDFAEGILAAAKESRADMIVLGSHSRRWLDQILMGSVTEKVLHNTSVPLYIIPTKHKE